MAKLFQVRGKKNLVIEKSLAGSVGIFVKFSTLQDYGVDKVFFLENDNVDASQRNVIFLARGEKASQPIAIAGMFIQEAAFHLSALLRFCVSIMLEIVLPLSAIFILAFTWDFRSNISVNMRWDHKVDYVDSLLLYLVSLDPKMKQIPNLA